MNLYIAFILLLVGVYCNKPLQAVKCDKEYHIMYNNQRAIST